MGVNYLKIFKAKYSIETGIYAKYNWAERSIASINFISRNLRVQLPLYIGYVLNDKWRINLGVSIENNRDFDQIHSKINHDYRFDFITKLVYLYNDKIKYSLYSNWIISSIPDALTIISPKNGIYFGAIYQI